MKVHKPLLVIILKYLVSLDNNSLLAFALTMLAESDDNKTINTRSLPRQEQDLQLLLDTDENILAFEILLYSYKQTVAKKTKANNEIALVFKTTANDDAYTPQALEYISKVYNILQQWYAEPHLIETIIAFLTKIYKQQLSVLEELMQASTEAINQITNFGIILSSQIVTMKSMSKKTEEQKKYTAKLSGSDIDKRTLITEIDKNRAQINDIAKLEQYAAAKIFPTLIKKLKHDYEIFHSKHRFMEEEFKIFLQERRSLSQDTVYSELSAANIYDLLKRIQHDIAKEIEFGRYDA